MQIGVVREIKDKEGRVALTPDGAKQLVALGHRVLVEEAAGLGAGFTDEAYRRAEGEEFDPFYYQAGEEKAKGKDGLHQHPERQVQIAEIDSGTECRNVA